MGVGNAAAPLMGTRKMWSSGVVLVAVLAALAMASAGHEELVAIPDSNRPTDVEFDRWLQDMAETSDNDDVTTLSSPPSSDADAVTGTWTGDVSVLTSNQDKDGSLKTLPKVNRDSIGVLPKATGKPKKVVVSKNGKGDYTTITEALNDIPLHATYRTIIHIKAGVYK